MASPYLPTEQAVAQSSPEVLGIERQRKLADLLTAQGFNQPQGQMISGHYVAPSWTQQLAPMANILAGTAISERADVKQQELANALRGKQNEAVSAFTEAKTPKEKFAAATSEYAPSWLKSIGAKMLEAQKAGEGDVIKQLNLETGAYDTLLSGPEKIRAPLHFDVGNAIELRDPKDPTKVLQRIPKGISPEAAVRLADEGIGGYGGGGAPSNATAPIQTIGQGSPILAKPTATASANPFEDFNKNIVAPAGLPPKAVRKWNEEANSALTGEAAKQVTGAVNTISAIDDYRKLIDEATRTGIVSPEQRAKLEASRNTMNLLGKEAYNLGVLNGPDLKILNSLTVDFNNPKSLLLSKKTLDNLIEKQRDVMGSTVLNVYGTQQKKIPQYVINKLKPAEIDTGITKGGKIERPSTVDQTTWNYMTDAEKALFRK